MKRLIINVDDVGFSDSINEAVKKCYSKKVISGVSIMSGGDFFEEAVDMLKDINKTEVGVHLTLTGKTHPCANSNDTSTILTKEGMFFEGYFEFMKYYFLNKINMDEIYLEFRSQILKIKNSGLEITHLDSHEHVHLFPKVLHIVLKLAKEFNIPFVRLPNERYITYTLKFTLKDVLRHFGLKLFSLYAKKIIENGDVKSNNIFWGHFHSGRVDKEILSFFIKNVLQGVNELCIHPAIKSEKLILNFPWFKKSHIELEALLSDDWKEECLQNNISIVSHSEI
ncbi:MAG: ChbG/HpnK family deacetylase [Melioribacteraceae bacterium]